MKKSMMSMMATVALLGLNGCGGNTGSGSTSASAKDILVGKTLYYVFCDNKSYNKSIFTSETLTISEHFPSGEIDTSNTKAVDYSSSKYSDCEWSEDSKSVTATCQDPKQNGTVWKTLADAKANPRPCNNTGSSTSPSVN